MMAPVDTIVCPHCRREVRTYGTGAKEILPRHNHLQRLGLNSVVVSSRRCAGSGAPALPIRIAIANEELKRARQSEADVEAKIKRLTDEAAQLRKRSEKLARRVQELTARLSQLEAQEPQP